MEYSTLSKELTSKLSKDEKKDNGIYFTPPSCVYNNIQLLHPYMTSVNNILEPSCGSGEYIRALNSVYPNINITGNVTGTSSNVQIVAGSYTSTFDNTGTLTLAGNIVGNVSGYSIGYRDIPQVSFTGNATLVAADAGKHYYSTQSTANTLTMSQSSSQQLIWKGTSSVPIPSPQQYWGCSVVFQKHVNRDRKKKIH